MRRTHAAWRKHLAWTQSACLLSVPDPDAVYPDRLYAFAGPDRFFKSGHIRYAIRIKHNKICEVTFAYQTSLMQSVIFSGKPCHSVNRIRKCQQFSLPHCCVTPARQTPFSCVAPASFRLMRPARRRQFQRRS